METMRLAEMRRELGLTQAQVATRMGVDQGRISLIEARNNPKISTLIAYCKAVGGTLELRAKFSFSGKRDSRTDLELE